MSIYTKPDSVKGCRDYLRALNGDAWNNMDRPKRSYEWRRLMAQRKAVGKKTYNNPYI